MALGKVRPHRRHLFWISKQSTIPFSFGLQDVQYLLIETHQTRKYILQEMYRISDTFKLSEQCNCRTSQYNPDKSPKVSRLVALHCGHLYPTFIIYESFQNLVRDATEFVVMHGIGLQLQCAWFGIRRTTNRSDGSAHTCLLSCNMDFVFPVASTDRAFRCSKLR